MQNTSRIFALFLSALTLPAAPAANAAKPKSVCSGRGLAELRKNCLEVAATSTNKSVAADAFVVLCKAEWQAAELYLMSSVTSGVPPLEMVGVGSCDKALELVPDYLPALSERRLAFFMSSLDTKFSPVKDKILAAEKRDADRITEAWPGKWEAWFERASYEYGHSNFAATWDALDKAAAIAPGQPEIHGMRAGLLLAEGKKSEALASYLKAVELGDDNFRTLKAIADLYRDDNDRPKAVEFYTRAINSGDDSRWSVADVHTERGLIYLNAHEDEKALADFKNALALNNSDQRALAGVKRITNKQVPTSAECKRSGPDPETIVKVVCTAAMEFAWDYDEMQKRARAYAALGKIDLAAADFDTMLNRDPDWIGYYTERAEMYFDAKRYREALADLDTFLSKFSPAADPKSNITDRAQRARLLVYLDRIDEALEEYALIKRLDIEADWYAAERAELLFHLGRTDGALKELEPALATNGPNGDARALRGAILARQGKTADAVVDLKWAAERKTCVAKRRWCIDPKAELEKLGP